MGSNKIKFLHNQQDRKENSHRKTKPPKEATEKLSKLTIKSMYGEATEGYMMRRQQQ